MYPHVEALMARRLVKHMVKTNVEELVLYRPQVVVQPDNSITKETPLPLPTQYASIVPFKRRFSQAIVDSEFGKIPKLPVVVLGEWDLDIERGDFFKWQDEWYTVMNLDLKKQTHKVAEAEYHGKTLRG